MKVLIGLEMLFCLFWPACMHPSVHPAHLGFPHEPEFKDVHMPATLDGLVPCVICNVVLFVWLEEVASAHGVAAC